MSAGRTGPEALRALSAMNGRGSEPPEPAAIAPRAAPGDRPRAGQALRPPRSPLRFEPRTPALLRYGPDRCLPGRARRAHRAAASWARAVDGFPLRAGTTPPRPLADRGPAERRPGRPLSMLPDRCWLSRG